MSALEHAAPAATQAAPRLSRPFVAALMLANFGTNVALIAPIQNVLPRMIEAAGWSGGKALGLGLVTGLGAFAALIANPVAGHYSDRWVGRDNRAVTVLIGMVTGGVAARHPGPATLHRRHRRLVDDLPGHDQHRVRADVRDRGGSRGPALVGPRLGADLRRAGGRAHHRPRRGRVRVPVCHRRDDRDLRRLRPVPDPAARGAVPVAPGQLTSPRAPPGRAVRASARCCRSSRASAWSGPASSSCTLAETVALLYLYYYVQDVVRYHNPGQGQVILVLAATLAAIVATVAVGRFADLSGGYRRYAVLVIAPDGGDRLRPGRVRRVGAGHYLRAGARGRLRRLPVGQPGAVHGGAAKPGERGP